jgi:RHS repeat-associated protein
MVWDCVLWFEGVCQEWGWVSQWQLVYDTGVVAITVNGVTKSAWYGQYSTASTMAADLAGAINADATHPTTASAVGSVVYLTSKATGLASNYTLSAYSYSDYPNDFNPPSFVPTPSGPALTGGGPGQGATYDTGNVWLTVNGQTKTVSYGQSSTGASLASALAAAINADGSYPVTAGANGSSITLTAKAVGASTNYSLSGGSSTDLPGTFSQPSFSVQVSGSSLTGGTDAGSGSLATPAVTTYTYNALDNLLSVVQSYSRQRTFTYNSLSQLMRAVNPESGQTDYTYDADGNLITKVDARGIVTCHGTWNAPNCDAAGNAGYDELHRLKKKTYSDSTPTVTFIYDVASVDGLSIQYPVGRLIKAATSDTRSVNSYDEMGRVKSQWQCTPLNYGASWFALAYTYNFVGMTSYTDGVGHTFTQAFNPAAQLTQLTSSLNDAQHPGTLLTVPLGGYNAAGAIENMIYGNGLYHRVDMNDRLQPCRMRVNAAAISAVNCTAGDPTGDVLQFKFSFNHGTANNGNVMSWTATGAQTFNRTYTYDGLNRLSSMASPGESCVGLNWTYDIWSNRSNQNGSGGPCPEHHPTILPNNRIAELGYDAAGNVTSDPGPPAKTFQYDAENRMVSVNYGCPNTLCYTYDANGRRVRKIASGTTTEYIYDVSGNVVAEKVGTAWTRGYAYLGGQLAAQYSDGTTYFVHKDHLGSTRLLTKVDKSVHQSYDFLPYGESSSCDGTTATTHCFTGKERDAESGLDFFLARYYSSQYGRFFSVDPENAGASTSDPQSWNGYSYARNNPLLFTDPEGLAYEVQYEAGFGVSFWCDCDWGELVAIITGPTGHIYEGDSLSGTIYSVRDRKKQRSDPISGIATRKKQLNGRGSRI